MSEDNKITNYQVFNVDREKSDILFIVENNSFTESVTFLDLIERVKYIESEKKKEAYNLSIKLMANWNETKRFPNNYGGI
jgi:hypothetical protein